MRHTPTFQDLLDRIEELERIIGVDKNLNHDLRQSTGCTKIEAKFIGMLYRREVVSRESMFTAIYGDRPECEHPQFKILDTHVCKVRGVLLQYGIAIETIWGVGYTMTPANKKILQELLEQEE